MPKKASSKAQTGETPRRKRGRNRTLPVEQTPPKQQITTAALDDSIGYLLKSAQFSTHGEFAEAMDEFEIRPSQYATLVLIHANPGLKQSALGGTLGIQKANFVALLDGLEVRGLTERRKLGTDRRSSAVFLTRAGRSFVARLKAAHDKTEAKIHARLGAEKSRVLVSLLKEFTSRAPLEALQGR